MNVPQHFSVGFFFNSDFSQVLLTRKILSLSQWDDLDGIRGEVEERESIRQAMRRSMMELTGLDIPLVRWNYFCDYSTAEGVRYAFLWAQSVRSEFATFKSPEDYPVVAYEVRDLDILPVRSNLTFLIPQAAHCGRTGHVFSSTKEVDD